jgi:antitoxin MazE
MKSRLIKIGNSRGVRLPKAVIEQAGLNDEIELEVKRNGVLIRRSGHPRAGWDEAFRAMAEAGDDELIDGPLPPLTTFDLEEWEW